MRAAKLARLAAGTGLGATRYREPFAAGVALTENPNRVKRGAARLDGSPAFTDIREASRDYRPLTVSHPTLDSLGRRNSRSRTAYTV